MRVHHQTMSAGSQIGHGCLTADRVTLAHDGARPHSTCAAVHYAGSDAHSPNVYPNASSMKTLTLMVCPPKPAAAAGAGLHSTVFLGTIPRGRGPGDGAAAAAQPAHLSSARRLGRTAGCPPGPRASRSWATAGSSTSNPAEMGGEGGTTQNGAGRPQLLPAGCHFTGCRLQWVASERF